MERAHLVKKLACAAACLLWTSWMAGCTPPVKQPANTTTALPQPAVQQSPAKPEPNLELQLVAPPQVTVGSEATLDLTIANRGTGPAKALTIKEAPHPGWERVRWEGASPQQLQHLNPGESRQAKLVFRVTQPGSVTHTVEVLEAGRLVASADVTLDAVPAEAPLTYPGQTPIPPPPAAGQPPAEPAPAVVQEPPPPPDLGPPLVDHPEELQRLHPNYPIWIDKDRKSVVMVGAVCQREVPLELFACTKNSKEHESVVVIDTKAYLVHAGLLATGVEPGNPVQFDPKYVPARGPEIEVAVAWKDDKGEVHHARGQDWVCHMQTGKAMELPWVFAGSQTLKDEVTGKTYYQADGEGDLICVSNFPSAVLDVPVESTSSDSALEFKAFTEHIPPRGTPVTVILTPKPAAPKAEAKPEAKPETTPEPKPEPTPESAPSAAPSSPPPPTPGPAPAAEPQPAPAAAPAAQPAPAAEPKPDAPPADKRPQNL